MSRYMKLILAAFAIPLYAATVAAQDAKDPGAKTETAKPSADSSKEGAKKVSTLPTIEIQHIRPYDARGLNIFEPPKDAGVPYTGFKLGIGAAFTQQFQGLSQSNTAAPKLVNGLNQNQLIGIGNGFNNAVANLYLNAQVAKGIRVAMTSYLSARHHQESWVKDGYALIDDSPIDNPVLNDIMKYTTLKVGHFEINYGDEHFRRTDNGEAMFNPFVGNLIMDAFTTEIGGEAYLRNGPWLAMYSVTGGEVHGQVTAPAKRSASQISKLGFDKQLTSDVRFRLTGSMYANGQSASNTLFTGDRAGGRYYSVITNVNDEADSAWTGNVRPGFSNNVHAYVVNPFVKVLGLEYFGNFETATGKGAAELTNRTIRQIANDLVYRFAGDQLYVGGRYNTVKGELAGIPNDITVNRYQVSAGWFVTPLMLTKVEYVNQKYLDFPSTDIRNGAQFKGFMVEATLAF